MMGERNEVPATPSPWKSTNSSCTQTSLKHSKKYAFKRPSAGDHKPPPAAKRPKTNVAENIKNAPKQTVTGNKVSTEAKISSFSNENIKELLKKYIREKEEYDRIHREYCEALQDAEKKFCLVEEHFIEVGKSYRSFVVAVKEVFPELSELFVSPEGEPENDSLLHNRTDKMESADQIIQGFSVKLVMEWEKFNDLVAAFKELESSFGSSAKKAFLNRLIVKKKQYEENLGDLKEFIAGLHLDAADGKTHTEVVVICKLKRKLNRWLHNFDEGLLELNHKLGQVEAVCTQDGPTASEHEAPVCSTNHYQVEASLNNTPDYEPSSPLLSPEHTPRSPVQSPEHSPRCTGDRTGGCTGVKSPEHTPVQSPVQSLSALSISETEEENESAFDEQRQQHNDQDSVESSDVFSSQILPSSLSSSSSERPVRGSQEWPGKHVPTLDDMVSVSESNGFSGKVGVDERQTPGAQFESMPQNKQKNDQVQEKQSNGVTACTPQEDSLPKPDSPTFCYSMFLDPESGLLTKSPVEPSAPSTTQVKKENPHVERFTPEVRSQLRSASSQSVSPAFGMHFLFPEVGLTTNSQDATYTITSTTAGQSQEEVSASVSTVPKDSKPCKLCPEVFPNKRALASHLKSHSEDNFYECEHCEHKSVSRYTFLKHKAEKHLTKKLKQNLCQVCLTHFDSFEKLFQHMKLKHWINGVTFSDNKIHCIICSFEYSDAAELTQHMKFHHQNDSWVVKASKDDQTGKPADKCRYCNIYLKNSKVRAIHVIIFHDSAPFDCGCGAKFYSKGILDNHCLNHTKAEEQKLNLYPKRGKKKVCQ